MLVYFSTILFFCLYFCRYITHKYIPTFLKSKINIFLHHIKFFACNVRKSYICSKYVYNIKTVGNHENLRKFMKNIYFLFLCLCLYKQHFLHTSYIHIYIYCVEHAKKLFYFFRIEGAYLWSKKNMAYNLSFI